MPVDRLSRSYKRDPGAHVGALDYGMTERPKDGHGVDEMGRQALQKEGTFPEPFVDQPEVQHLEVPEAPVDELARLARRARGPVLRLHQPNRKTTRHRVQGHACTRYAAPYHEHVEWCGPEPGQVAVPAAGRQLAWLVPGPSVQLGPPPRGAARSSRARGAHGSPAFWGHRAKGARRGLAANERRVARIWETAQAAAQAVPSGHRREHTLAGPTLAGNVRGASTNGHGGDRPGRCTSSWAP